jgi:DNA-binding transcriptional regulator YiaG
MDIKCECGGTLKPVKLDSFDFSTIAGLPCTLQAVPGLRCSSCKRETLDGEVINQALRLIVHDIVRMPQLLPGSHARFLRRNLRLSQQELADRMGINRVTVAKWESGAEPISAQHDLMLRSLVVSSVMREQPKPKAVELKELAEAIGGVRQQTSVPPPFVIEDCLSKLRGRSTRLLS